MCNGMCMRIEIVSVCMSVCRTILAVIAVYVNKESKYICQSSE